MFKPMRATFTILALAAFFSLFAPAFGQSASDVEALTKKEQAARDKAKALESERAKVRKDVSSLKKSLAKKARQTQGIETDLTALEIETATLTKRAERLTAQMEAGKRQYAELLAALQRLETSLPPSLAITPNNAKRASDAGHLMTTISEQLKKRAGALSLSLKALDVTQSQLALKKTDLSAMRTRLETEMKTVNIGLNKKSKLEAKLADEKKSAAAEADKLAAESKSLRDLIAKLESEAARVVPRTKPGRKPTEKLVLPKGTKRFAEAKGGMIQPVSGRLLKSFGRGEKGQTYIGRSGGQVIAPYAGRVEFSGPFKNYDNVIILNVGDGYFVLLTGLNDLYVDAGDTIQRGEPVGKLPVQKRPELYIELRRNGSPVNPKPWLAAQDVKTG